MIIMAKEMRQLKGKGEFDYDYVNDILSFKVKDREYEKSIESDRFVIDIDKEDFVVGLQIFEASEFFGLDKVQLRQIKQCNFIAIVDEGRIEIRFVFQTVYRNKTIIHKPIISEPLTEHLPDSRVVCTV